MTDTAVENKTIINVFQMLTDKLSSLEDQIKEQRVEQAKQLRLMYANSSSVCNGEIFNVHCPVLHIGRRILYEDPEHIYYLDDDEAKMMQYKGYCETRDINLILSVDEKTIDKVLADLKAVAGHKVHIYLQNQRGYGNNQRWFTFSYERANQNGDDTLIYIDHIKELFQKSGHGDMFQYVWEIVVTMEAC